MRALADLDPPFDVDATHYPWRLRLLLHGATVELFYIKRDAAEEALAALVGAIDDYSSAAQRTKDIMRPHTLMLTDDASTNHAVMLNMVVHAFVVNGEAYWSIHHRFAQRGRCAEEQITQLYEERDRVVGMTGKK